MQLSAVTSQAILPVLLAFSCGALGRPENGAKQDNSSFFDEGVTLTRLNEEYSSCNGIDIREITIERLQTLFATNMLTSKVLTECYIQRIRAMNPYLHAVIQVNPDAILIAESLDKERAAQSVRSHLHGIPVLVKDNYATKDKMETTAGSWALVGVKPVRDAEAVRKLREAGVVIMGKANLGEMAFFRGTNIPNGWSGRGGLTKNAYNLMTSPQGSSSGSTVATSTNLVTAAIGTETDGSLISPASVAAVVALKPTFGLVSIEGLIPISRNQDHAGPIARTVMDAAYLLDGMVSQHGDNLQSCGGTYSSCLKANASSQTKFRIGVPRTPFWKPDLANSTLLEGELPVLDELLKKLNSDPRLSVLDHLKRSWDDIQNISDAEVIVVTHDFKHDMNLYLQNFTEPQNSSSLIIHSLADMIEFNNLHPSPEGYNQEIFIQSQNTDGLQNATYLEALKTNRENATRYLDDLLDGYKVDVIAVPSEPRYNVTVDPALGQSPFVGWTIASVAGYPSINLPVGLDPYGVPYGICLIGKPHMEVTLLRIAKLIEDIWPARQPPTFRNSLN